MGIRMEVKLTDGYQQRFTSACLAQIGSRKEVTKIEDGNEGYFITETCEDGIRNRYRVKSIKKSKVVKSASVDAADEEE